MLIMELSDDELIEHKRTMLAYMKRKLNLINVMPLTKGYSRKAISHNISAEKKAGKSKKQSVAIALSVAREAAKKAGVSRKKIGK